MTELKPCTCDSMDLLKGGCTCGAIVPYEKLQKETQESEAPKVEENQPKPGSGFSYDPALIAFSKAEVLEQANARVEQGDSPFPFYARTEYANGGLFAIRIVSKYAWDRMPDKGEKNCGTICLGWKLL